MKKITTLFILMVLLSISMNALAITWTSYALVDGLRKGYVKASNPVFSPDGNTIYIPTSTPNGHLFAVNRATGAINWVFEITGVVTYGGGAVVGSDGTIYQGARDKKVYAINPDGTQKWATAVLAGNFDAFPALSADGVIYYLANGTTNSTLYALNASTGAEIWNKTITGTTGGAVAIDNVGNVYAGTNSKIVKYNAAGTLQWDTGAASHTVTESGSFAIDSERNTLYAARKSTAGIAALNMTDGTTRWTRTSGGDAYFPIVGNDGTIYFNEKLASGKVYAVNPDGTEKWTTTIGASMNYGGLVLSDAGKLYGGTQAKIGTYYQIFEIDATTGTKTVLLETTHQLSASATIGPDNKLYIGSIREGVSPLEDNGRLFVFDINAGLEKKSWSMRGNDIQGLNRRTSAYVSSSANISSIAASSTIDVTVSSGLLTVDDNATVKTLTVNPGAKLTLAAGKTLTVVGGMTLQSDATGTATLIDSYETPTVNASVQQYVSAGRNWYISSPVSAADYSWLSRGTSVVEWSETIKDWVTVNSGALVKGKGYIQVATSTPTVTGTTGTVNVTGTTNSGDVAISVSRTESGSSRGFNLVGNPYPSYLKWTGVDGFLAETTNDSISTSFWLRTKNTLGDYVFTTYNGSSHEVVGGTNATTLLNEYIPPMQAFWIRVNANTAVSTHNVGLTFKNNMRFHGVGDNNKFKAPKQNNRTRLRLQVSNGSYSDESLLYFDDNAQNSFDNYDSPKMFNNVATKPEIFTNAGTEKLVINGMNEIPYNTEIPVGFMVGESGNFTLSSVELSNFESGTRILLKDKLYPASEFELAEGVSYNFSSQPTTASTDRFSLVFRAPSVTTAVDNTSKLNAQVFVNAANQITIIAPEKSSYVIYNAVGQLSSEGTINHSPFTINHSKGVYVVKVGNTNSTRVIIK